MKQQMYRADIQDEYGSRVSPIMEGRNFDVIETRSMAKAATLTTSAFVHFFAGGRLIQSYKVGHPAKAMKG